MPLASDATSTCRLISAFDHRHAQATIEAQDRAGFTRKAAEKLGQTPGLELRGAVKQTLEILSTPASPSTMHKSAAVIALSRGQTEPLWQLMSFKLAACHSLRRAPLLHSTLRASSASAPRD